MSIERCFKRRDFGAALSVVVAVALTSSAVGQVQEHGIALSQACDSPVCVDENIDCTFSAIYADSFDDAILITGAFSLVDPFGANERVPAGVDSLPIIFVGGNAAATMVAGQPTFPVLIGPPNSTFMDPDTGLMLPGDADPGQVQVRNDQFTVEAMPDPLLILQNITWIDRCNEEPGNTGCSPGNEQLANGLSTIDIAPLPQPTANAMPGELCLGATATLEGGPDGLVSYEWRDAMGNILCMTQDCEVTPTEVGTFEYFLRVVDQNGCEAETSTLLTVVDAPQCMITGQTSLCPGDQDVAYTVVETTGLDPSEFSFEWDISGDASFCPGSPTAGPDVTVCADNVCGSFTLAVLVFRNDDPECFSTCNLVVTLDDDTPPTLVGLPNDLTLECGDPIPDPPLVECVDDCATDLVPQFSSSTSGDNCEGIITWTWTCTDRCGNTTTESRTITILDTLPPVLSGVPGDVTQECDVPVPDPAEVMCMDACDPNVMAVLTEVSDGGNCPEIITRTWTCTDRCGNAVSAMQIITLVDTTPPVLSGVPDDVTQQCDAPLAAPADVTCMDNCDPDVVPVFTEVSDGGSCPEIITRTWTCTDRCGNTVSDTQTITIVDMIPPVITCPPDIEVDCPERVPPPKTTLNQFLVQGGSASDNCAIEIFEHVGDFAVALETETGAVLPTGGNHRSKSAAGPACLQMINRVYRVVDACGNESSCTQVIVIDDQEPPAITCPPDVVEDCPERVPDPALDLNQFLVQGGSATDNCGITGFFWDGDQSSGTCPLTILRTYRVVDACGNENTCTQTITVDDQEPPAITCPPDILEDCPERVPDPALDLNQFLVQGGSVSDNCGVTGFFWDGDQSSGTCPLTILRTYRVVDACGNEGTCMQTITVDDQEPPAITCPADTVVECVALVPPAAQTLNQFLVQGGLASDNCEIVEFEHLGDDVDGTACPQVITRTYRVADACGNENTCTQTITVNDDEPPVITCPPDLSVQCPDLVPPPLAGLEAFLIAGGTVFDNCGEVDVTLADETVDGAGCPQTILRTYRATDLCGNVAECVRTITVNDDQAPVITCPADVTVSCASQVPPADPNQVSCVDNCTPPEALMVTLVGETQSGECPLVIVRTWRCEDECGNADECEQVITVDDTTPPVITCPDDAADLECDVPYPFTVTAADDCGEVTITCSVVGGSGELPVLEDLGNGQFTVQFSATGTATILCTATDACGNPSQCQFDVSADCFCTIGDFLWLDINGDGCQDMDEPGVAHVTLVLYTDCDMPQFVATTVTDENGVYRFDNLDCDVEYLIVIESDFSETIPDNCGDDEIDSDCIEGMICLTTDSANPVDLTYDCGFVECDLLVDLEGCVIPPPPGPVGDACDGKVTELVLNYSVEDCSATSTQQPDDKWDCEDFGPLPDMVYVVVSKMADCSGDIFFAGDVMVGEDLVAQAQAAGLNEFGSNTYVCIFDFDGGTLLQSLRFHTSCSQPLGPGDQFGSLLLVQMTTTNGGTVGLPEPPDPDECITEIVAGDAECDGNLLTLDLTYTGEDCGASVTNQDDSKWDCTGDPAMAEPVRILVTNESGSEVYADEPEVYIGQTVYATAANAGQSDFENQTRVRVYDQAGMLLQDVDFHTSCSQPLGVGDQFGSQLISGISSTDGGSGQLGGEVEYTYTVTNNGSGTVTNVTVIDDVYGEIPGSPIPSLGPGDTVLLMLTVIVTETTMNMVTVMGNDDPDCTAEDSTTITVVGPPQDCCENGKPRALTMLYTGEDCGATSTSQPADKWDCEDFGPLPETVYILATDKANPDDGGAMVWFAGTVSVDDLYDIDATNAGETKLQNTTYIHIFDVAGGTQLQFVEFHTSCSQPLMEGDQFGASLLVGCIGENEPIPGDCCANGDKPAILTMQHTGEDCTATMHAQSSSSVECEDFGPLPGSVYVLATDKSNPYDGGARVWFSGTVKAGGTYDIDATNAGQTKLASTTYVHVFDEVGGTQLQFIKFHTSCSQPLFLGNQFGSALLVACIGENQLAVWSHTARAAVPTAASSCAGDFDADGHVGAADLAQLVQHWGPAAGAGTQFDLDADGEVGAADLAEMVTRWGACP